MTSHLHMAVGFVVLVVVRDWIAHSVTFSVDGRRFDCFTTDSNEGHHEAHNAHAQHDAVVPVIFSHIASRFVEHSVEDVVAEAGNGAVLIYYSTLEEDIAIAYIISTHGASSEVHALVGVVRD